MYTKTNCFQSDAVISFFLYILKEVGVVDVPSLSTIKSLPGEDKMEEMLERVGYKYITEISKIN